jgi:hypothetical protein
MRVRIRRGRSYAGSGGRGDCCEGRHAGMAGRCKGRAACESWKGATADAGAWGCWKREDEFARCERRWGELEAARLSLVRPISTVKFRALGSGHSRWTALQSGHGHGPVLRCEPASARPPLAHGTDVGNRRPTVLPDNAPTLAACCLLKVVERGRGGSSAPAPWHWHWHLAPWLARLLHCTTGMIGCAACQRKGKPGPVESVVAT